METKPGLLKCGHFPASRVSGESVRKRLNEEGKWWRDESGHAIHLSHSCSTS